MLSEVNSQTDRTGGALRTSVSGRGVIGKSLSTYLDLLRFVASLLVALEHSVLLGLLPRVPILTDLSHESVVVFFVLSGLVIAASTLARPPTAREYVAARVARISCVAVPALICCYGVQAATSGASLAQFASSLFFLDGVWFNFGAVPFNGPYWSLCYEVWYYAGWGVLLFVARPRIRVLAGVALLVVMGPAFAALSGIWLMGAFVAMKRERIIEVLQRLPRWTSAALCACSVIGVLGLASSTLEDSIKLFLSQRIHGWWRMRGSEYMVTDYVLGVLVAIHLVTALYLFGDGSGFHDSRAGRVIRYCASFTFTLYLFHYPILLVLRATSGSPSASMAGGIGFIGLTLGAVWLIAFTTERQLPRWRQMSRAALGLQVRDGARSASASGRTIVLGSLS